MGHEPYLVFLFLSKNPIETIIVWCRTGRFPFVTFQHRRVGNYISEYHTPECRSLQYHLFTKDIQCIPLGNMNVEERQHHRA